MRIGEVASRSGVSVRSLRYYEEQGLLHSERSGGGQRTYGAYAVERVRLVQQLYAAGLASRTIRVILPCVDTGETTPELLELLAGERDRIEAQIADLEQARLRLDLVISRAGQPNAECSSPSGRQSIRPSSEEVVGGRL